MIQELVKDTEGLTLDGQNHHTESRTGLDGIAGTQPEARQAESPRHDESRPKVIVKYRSAKRIAEY